MSKRVQSWKRALVMLSMGGATFHFALGGFGLEGCYQPRNADFVNLYQTSGSAAIGAVSDSAIVNDNVANSDYDLIVRNPLTTFTQTLWNNWVSLQMPLDPSSGNVFRQ